MKITNIFSQEEILLDFTDIHKCRTTLSKRDSSFYNPTCKKPLCEHNATFMQLCGRMVKFSEYKIKLYTTLLTEACKRTCKNIKFNTFCTKISIPLSHKEEFYLLSSIYLSSPPFLIRHL